MILVKSSHINESSDTNSEDAIGTNYIEYTEKEVRLRSPTCLSPALKIANPNLRLSTSKEGLLDLINIENQIS